MTTEYAEDWLTKLTRPEDAMLKVGRTTGVVDGRATIVVRVELGAITTIGRPAAEVEKPGAGCVVFAYGAKVTVVADTEDVTNTEPVAFGVKTLELGVKVITILDVLLTETEVWIGTMTVDIMAEPLYVAVSTVEKGVAATDVLFMKLTTSVVLVVLVDGAAVVLVVVVATDEFTKGNVKLEVDIEEVVTSLKDEVELTTSVVLDEITDEVLVVDGGANVEIGVEWITKIVDKRPLSEELLELGVAVEPVPKMIVSGV